MNDDKAQAALATLCRYVQNECRDETLDRLRKQRYAATQRAHTAKRKLEKRKRIFPWSRTTRKPMVDGLNKLGKLKHL